MWRNNAFLVNSIAMSVVVGVLTYRLVSLPLKAPLLLRVLTAFVIFAATANGVSPYVTIQGAPLYPAQSVPWPEALFNLSLAPLLLYLLRHPLRTWEES